MVRKTKLLSISVLVSEIDTFLTKKRSSLWISTKMLQNNTKALFISMWLTLWRKIFFVNIYLLLLVWSKQFFKQIQIFFRICSFSNMVRKTNFLSISVIFFESVTFVSKKKVLYEFPQKCFKTTERHCLAVCGSVCGEKQFLLLFIPFFWFDQKKLFKQIQIFHRIRTFQTW